jgi:hypothetical protein
VHLFGLDSVDHALLPWTLAVSGCSGTEQTLQVQPQKPCNMNTISCVDDLQAQHA